ncbi:MAG: alanine/glycine:cation symporter family protein [Planctomycetota bacterium]
MRLPAAFVPLVLVLQLLASPLLAQENGEVAEAPSTSLAEDIDATMGGVNQQLAKWIFYPIPLTTETSVPFAVALLVLGALYFTLRMGFIQVRAFWHAIRVTRGKYDDPLDEGEVSHSQALWTALSATVGLGNIGGVALAVTTGGPGATFWMIVAGFLGMASKFTECTLGQMYREVRPDGRVMGGAMFYLSKGFRELGLAGPGKILAVVFAVFCVGASFGGGNTFQVSQSVGAISHTFTFLQGHEWMYGLVMSILVGVVILGGIQSIAKTAERIVPTMCIIYVLAALAILLMRIEAVPAAMATIVREAFTPQAGLGGMLGVLIVGFQRAAFSNEAGVGSAAIAHSAARTQYSVREGIVALLEPFIDTIVVCTMTALVIVVTGAYSEGAYMALHGDAGTAAQVGVYAAAKDGAALTSLAMGHVLPFFPYVLAIAVFLFAFSTMISWSYYGERCWAYLFGDSSSIVYRLIFVIFVFLGSIITAQNVLEFGDLLIFGMAIPNVIGVVFLAGKVKRKLNEYLGLLNTGQLPTYK